MGLKLIVWKSTRKTNHLGLTSLFKRFSSPKFQFAVIQRISFENYFGIEEHAGLAIQIKYRIGMSSDFSFTSIVIHGQWGPLDLNVIETGVGVRKCM